jgi:hypothetical protein
MNHAAKIATLAVGLNLVLAPRLLAGPPFLTDDPEPVDYQHWEAYIFTLGDHSDSGYNAEGHRGRQRHADRHRPGRHRVRREIPFSARDKLVAANRTFSPD